MHTISIYLVQKRKLYIYTHIGIYKYSVFLCHYLYITISYFFRGLFLLLSYWATTWMPFCGALRLHLGIYQLRPDARNSLSTLCLRDRRGLLGCCSGSWCCAPAFFEGRLPMEPCKSLTDLGGILSQNAAFLYLDGNSPTHRLHFLCAHRDFW